LRGREGDPRVERTTGDIFPLIQKVRKDGVVKWKFQDLKDQEGLPVRKLRMTIKEGARRKDVI